jgi:signal peptidase II
LTTTVPRRERTTGTTRQGTRPAWQPLGGVGLIAALVVVLDQLSKAWIVANFGRDASVHGQSLIAGVLDLHYLENTGAAFGQFQGAGWILGVIAVVVIAVILILVPRLHARPEGAPWPLLLALALVLGGALGNLIDRVRVGYVVDFVTPTFARVTLGDTIYQFPTFNVADSSITVGVLLLLVGFLFTGESTHLSSASAAGSPPKEATMADSERPVRMARLPGSGTAPITPLGLAGALAIVGGIWAWAIVKALQGRRKRPKARGR